MNELTNPQTQSFLERATRDPAIDVAKLEQLIMLQERVADREARRQFADAMNSLQEEMPQVTKDRLNPHTRSRYATYEEVDRVIRPFYVRHGFSTSFRTSTHGGRIRVQCVVKHVGGHEEDDHELESGPDLTGSKGQTNKTEVQGIGSIVSYLKRYTLMAAFGVAIKDDETEDDGARGGDMRSEAERLMRERQSRDAQQQVQQPTLREWFDAFEKECAAADTQDEATKILNRFPDAQPPEWMADKPNAKARFEKIRQAMIDRIWPIKGDDGETIKT